MANLLDSASIVLTPTAYDNGSMLSVKPNDGAGDFDFSRNSAATRVNAQGLVENVQILSGNLVSNGDFSQEGVEEVSNGSFSQEGAEEVTNGDFATDSGWTKGAGWSISGGTANALSVGSGQSLSQGTSIVASKIYRVDYTVSNFVEGGVYVRVGNSGTGTIRQENGTYTEYITQSGNTTIYFTAYSGSTTLSIDNISVKEVGQDWTLGAGISIGSNEAIFTSVASGQQLAQLSLSGVVGKTYKISYEIKSRTSGAFSASIGTTLSANQNSSVGVYTEYLTATTTAAFYIRSRGTTSGSITNISVKEVGQDWNVTSTDANNYVEFGDGTARLKFLNTSPITQLASSTGIYQGGKKYKLIVDIADATSGSIKVDAAGVSETFTTAGISTRIINPTGNSALTFYRGTANVDITLNSVSLIEITDDTNLPRINYEGFSYQDSLGSELIVNGDFATDTDWIKRTGVTISDGRAICDSNNNLLRQTLITLNPTTLYKYEFSLSNYVSGNVRFSSFAGSVNANSNGTFTAMGYPSDINNMVLFGEYVGDIDNVSVKEYLGQEVVPDSGCGSWLLEPQSTNLITYSEDFSSLNIRSNAVVTSNQIISPSGLLDADEITFDGTASGRVEAVIPVTVGQAYTISLYLKNKDLSDVTQVWIGFSAASQGQFVTITDDWQRYDITTNADGSSEYPRIQFSGTGSLYAWGFQTEQQSYATSYIPTNGAASTRLQDIANNSGNATLFNSTEGVLYAEIETFSQTGTFRQINLNNGSTSSRIYITKRAENDLLEFRMDNALGNLNFGFPINTTNQFIKVAFRYGVNNFAVFIDGVNKNVTPNGNTFSAETLNNLELNSPLNQPFYGKVKALVVYKEALTDEQLTCLTTI